MKRTYQTLVCATVLAFSAAGLQAQNTTVLEGFEDYVEDGSGGTVFSVDPYHYAYVSLWTQWGGRSSAGKVLLHMHTATSPDDPRVTEGTNSVAVTFLQDGFGNDLGVALKDLATEAIENAVSSNQLARYILRYDVIFDHADQYIYFNQHALIGNDWDYLTLGGAVYKTNAGVVYAVASFSVPLESAGIALPTSGSLGWWGGSWIITDQFGTRQPTFTNCTIYLDNVRLVDTYAPGKTPVIYPLKSFENPADPLDGATNLYPTVTSFFGNITTNRATLTQFLTNGLYDPTSSNGVPGIYTTNKGPIDGDFAVTDGLHALQVSNRWRDNINFEFDFSLPFAGTKLAEILAQPHSLADLAHYTLRWDTTMPAVWPANDGDYINMVFATGASYFPMAQGRRQSLGQIGLQRVTYQTTLDQITAWGGSPTGGDPAILFAFNGAPEGIPFVYYFDNFMLIDTAPQPEPPVLRSWQYDPVSRRFTLTWSSAPGAIYTVLSSSTLAPGSFTPVATGIPSGGAQTTTTLTLPGGNAGFLRVGRQ